MVTPFLSRASSLYDQRGQSCRDTPLRTAMDIHSQLLPLTFLQMQASFSRRQWALLSRPPVSHWPHTFVPGKPKPLHVCWSSSLGFVLQRAMVSFKQPLSLTECSHFTFFQHAGDMGQSCCIRTSMCMLFKAEVSCRSTRFM